MSIVAATVGALTLAMTSCASDDGSSGDTDQTSPPPAASAASEVTDAPSVATQAPAGGDAPADDAFVPVLDVDPCSLLTIPEMEAAIGSGVEQGGFGEDQPGRCTYSIGGDVGAGVVGISLGIPLLCDALERAIDAGGTASGTVVDVGAGGIVATEGGSIQFLIGKGCIDVGGSDGGDPLDQDALVTLANAAAGRVG